MAMLSCQRDEVKEDPVGPGEETAERPAVLFGTRVNTPGGRVYYMGAYSDIPEKVDYKSMVELGSSVTIYSYGEHPYVWNGAASTLTKYNVSDDLAISPSDFVSFASTGLGGFFGPPAFLSETQAYFFVLSEGKVIEFNPSTMEIIEVIDVEALPGGDDAEVNTSTYYSFVTGEGKILLPVDANPGDFDKFPQYAQVAVFDPSAKTIAYSSDGRMSMGYNNFAKDVSNGDLYYRPSKNVVRAQDYTGLTDFPTTGGILKMNADGTYDQDFFVDLEEALNAHCINSVIYVYGSKAVVQYVDASWEAPEDPGEWFNCPTQLALVDLNTLEHEPFSALQPYGVVYAVGTVDGQEYYANFSGEDGKYYFIAQSGPTDFEAVTESIGGSGIYVGRLR